MYPSLSRARPPCLLPEVATIFSYSPSTHLNKSYRTCSLPFFSLAYPSNYSSSPAFTSTRPTCCPATAATTTSPTIAHAPN